MNFDVSFKYCLPAGLVSVAPFYKHIDNPIYDRSVTEQNAVHNGRTYARFGLSRPRTRSVDISLVSSSTTRQCSARCPHRSTVSEPTSTTHGPIRR